MAEYTPTTAAVRERYSMQAPVQEMLKAEFDRWLAAHDANVKAEAAAEERARIVEKIAEGADAWEATVRQLRGEGEFTASFRYGHYAAVRRSVAAEIKGVSL